jgi:hypothetical protein
MANPPHPRKATTVDLSDRGMDLSNPDVTTEAEWESWRQTERERRGYPLPSYELVGEFRPDAVKRWMRQAQNFTVPEGLGGWGILTWVHLYLIEGFEPGTIYELRNSEGLRVPRSAVLDVLALALFHSPSKGLHHQSEAVAEYIRDYLEPAEPLEWPEGWEHDPEFFRSGIDFSTLDLSADELRLLEDWYLRVMGEVPRHVQLLAELRPRLLKAYRDRFENVIRESPKQLMPMCLLHYEAYRGHEDGIREAVLLARGCGMTQAQAVEALAWAMLYGAHGSMSNVDRAAGDILRAW